MKSSNMKNKKWYNNLSNIISSLALLGVLGGGIVVTANYINLPKITEAIAEEQKETTKRIDKIERYIDINQAILENNQKQQQMQQQYQQKQEQPYCEVYEGNLFCWDEQSQQWYQQEGG